MSIRRTVSESSVIFDINEEVKWLDEYTGKLTAKVDALKKELSAHKEACRKQCDEFDQYTRLNNLHVFGIPEIQCENTDEVARYFFMSILGVSLEARDIESSHRVGKAPLPDDEGRVKPRAILVRFANYRHRRLVFERKKILRGTYINIKEDLTSHRLDLLKKAEGIYGSKNVWTVDGKICWKDENNVKGFTTWKL